MYLQHWVGAFGSLYGSLRFRWWNMVCNLCVRDESWVVGDESWVVVAELGECHATVLSTLWDPYVCMSKNTFSRESLYMRLPAACKAIVSSVDVSTCDWLLDVSGVHFYSNYLLPVRPLWVQLMSPRVTGLWMCHEFTSTAQWSDSRGISMFGAYVWNLTAHPHFPWHWSVVVLWPMIECSYFVCCSVGRVLRIVPHIADETL